MYITIDISTYINYFYAKNNVLLRKINLRLIWTDYPIKEREELVIPWHLSYLLSHAV